MAEISKIKLPSGTTYDLKDTVARQMASGVIHLIQGVNETPLTDRATTNPIIVDGKSYTAVSGDATFWENKEFVYDGSIWHEFGDLTGLKALAYKDTASASYTPSGAVSTPSFTGAELTSTGTYTPGGSVSTPTISVKTAGNTTTVNSITDVGTLPSLTTTVSDEILTIAFNQGSLPTKGSDTTVKTGDAEYQSTTPTFTGNEATISVAGTPEGTISTPTFTGDTATITVS